jgi:excisionase family DNA binding protein
MDNTHHSNAGDRMCRQPVYRRERDEFSPLVTPEEAGAFLRVHPKTINRLARTKQIPALRIGRQWRYRWADLIDWAAGQVESACQPVGC